MLSLKTVFERNDKQKVWYKVTKIEDTDNYNIFFIAQRKEVNSPFICVRIMCTPELVSDFFMNLSKIQELKLKDTELEDITLSSGAFQYWYVAGSAAADADDVTVKVVEREKKDVGYYEVVDGKTSVTHLEFSVFSGMFESSESMILNSKEVLENLLIENGKAERKNDEREWKPEDGPTSYKALLLRLIRAEALRAMSARHPGFVTELPFAYGNFHEGYPVVFCKQDDIFFGTVDNVGITHSEAGGRTLASISGIVSIRDALKLSSVTLKQLTSDDLGVTLGFAFVNPIAVNLGTDRKFDWRRCAVIDQSKINNKLPSIEVRLSEVLGLTDYFAEWIIAMDSEVPGAYEFITQQLGQGATLYSDSYYKVQAGDFKRFLNNTPVSVWEPFLRFDEKLFANEIHIIYTQRTSERTVGRESVSIIKRLNEIVADLKKMWDDQYVFPIHEVVSSDVIAWSYNSVPFNMSDTVLEEWNRLKQEYEIWLPLIFTDMPGVLDKETEWLYRIIPACTGLSEASESDYADLLVPRQMFSDNLGEDRVYTETDVPGILASGLMKPLPRAVLKKGASVYNAAKAIILFIDNVRTHVNPYVIRKKIEDPEDTINVKGGGNG